MANLLRIAIVAAAGCAAFAATAVLTLDEFLPLEPHANFAVSVRTDDASATDATPDSRERVFMTGADGDEFECFLPSMHANELGEKVKRNEWDERVKAAAAAANAGGTDRKCLTRQGGYWTIEVCPGRRVRQYHVEAPAAAAAPQQQVLAGPSIREYSLGEYVPEKDKILTTALGVLEYHQTYSAGDDGRDSVVKFVCEPAGLASLALAEDIVFSEEAPPHHYTIAVGTRNPALCELLPSPASIIRHVNNTCHRTVVGWWTYVVCIGTTIRQHHDLGGGKVQQETVVGNYDWEFGERMLSGPPAAAAGVGPPSSLIQSYGGGSICDPAHGNPKPRAATLLFECLPPTSDDGGGAASRLAADARDLTRVVILEVREPSTCVYEIVLGSVAACNHPSVAPSAAVGKHRQQQPPPAIIDCRALHRTKLGRRGAADAAEMGSPTPPPVVPGGGGGGGEHEL